VDAEELGAQAGHGFSGCGGNKLGLGCYGMGRGTWCACSCACSPPGRFWRLRAYVTKWAGPRHPPARGDGNHPTVVGRAEGLWSTSAWSWKPSRGGWAHWGSIGWSVWFSQWCSSMVQMMDLRIYIYIYIYIYIHTHTTYNPCCFIDLTLNLLLMCCYRIYIIKIILYTTSVHCNKNLMVP
jgi:hypothetical protein